MNIPYNPRHSQKNNKFFEQLLAKSEPLDKSQDAWLLAHAKNNRSSSDLYLILSKGERMWHPAWSKHHLDIMKIFLDRGLMNADSRSTIGVAALAVKLLAEVEPTRCTSHTAHELLRVIKNSFHFIA